MLPLAVTAVRTGPEEGAPGPEGLRARKREKTRLSIEDAALELFAEQGYEATTVEQIAARAEVSEGTFFRYFRSKGEALFVEREHQIPALQHAIVERPADEDDFEAVRRALQNEWVDKVDPERIVRQTQAINSSHVLTGLSYQIGVRWREAISHALAERNRLPEPDGHCRLVAGTALAVYGNAVLSYVMSGAEDDLGQTVNRTFELMAGIGRDWLRSIDAERQPSPEEPMGFLSVD
jgi:AcrR family transcriptional regulator